MFKVHASLAGLSAWLVVGCSGAPVDEPGPDESPKGEQASEGPLAPKDGPSSQPGPEKGCIAKGEVVAPLAASLEGAFAASCSGCHGATGDGVGKFPALHEDKGFEFFAKLVRAGKEGKAGVMPSFGEDYVSDAEMLRMYTALVGKTMTAEASLSCGGRMPLSAERIEAAFREGLVAWRAPDGEGAACASCHGVMPFDLAYIGYDDATIYRRALKHISEEQMRQVVEFVHAIRAKYELGGPKSFLDFRPFQPGGRVLEGATAAERDHKFGLNLTQVAPTLFAGPLDTRQKALKAKDELLAINPRTFPIGIPLNRWTEDMHHGGAHATFNDWIPDRPHVPKDEASRQALFALHDEYIQNPSWDKVWALQDRLDELTTLTGVEKGLTGGGNYDGFAYGMYDLKYKSVLFAQHHFLVEATRGRTLAQMSAAPFPRRNTLWELADFARVSSSVSFAHNCQNSWNGCLGLPHDAVEKIDPQRTAERELHDLKLSWFWVGWFVDTSLYQTSNSNSTKVSEYFTGTLYEDGYYDHVVYHRIRKNLATGYEFEAPIKDANGQPGIDHPWAHTYGYYLAYGRGIDEKKMPKDPEARELYVVLTANTLRMMLLLATDEIERTKQVSNKSDMLAIYEGADSAFLRFMKAYSTDLAKDEGMLEAYRNAIAQACDRKPVGYKQSPTADSCFAK